MYFSKYFTDTLILLALTISMLIQTNSFKSLGICLSYFILFSLPWFCLTLFRLQLPVRYIDLSFLHRSIDKLLLFTFFLSYMSLFVFTCAFSSSSHCSYFKFNFEIFTQVSCFPQLIKHVKIMYFQGIEKKFLVSAFAFFFLIGKTGSGHHLLPSGRYF